MVNYTFLERQFQKILQQLQLELRVYGYILPPKLIDRTIKLHPGEPANW